MLFHYIFSIVFAAVGLILTVLGFVMFVASQENRLWFIVFLVGLGTFFYFRDLARKFRDEMRML